MTYCNFSVFVHNIYKNMPISYHLAVYYSNGQHEYEKILLFNHVWLENKFSSLDSEVDPMACWSSGMIRASGARGPGFDSRTGPILRKTKNRR